MRGGSSTPGTYHVFPLWLQFTYRLLAQPCTFSLFLLWYTLVIPNPWRSSWEIPAYPRTKAGDFEFGPSHLSKDRIQGNKNTSESASFINGKDRWFPVDLPIQPIQWLSATGGFSIMFECRSCPPVPQLHEPRSGPAAELWHTIAGEHGF